MNETGIREERDEIPDELLRAQAFHSHLGPFLVVGLKMGQAVVDRLGEEPFSYSIKSFTGLRPPLSCLIDGLQLSTPCTVGNGRLSVVDDGEIRVTATGRGRQVEITLLADVEVLIRSLNWSEGEKMAFQIWQMPEDELLDVQERSDG